MNVACLATQFARSGEQTAVLQGEWSIFHSRHRTGSICYRLRFGTALSPGGPLCAPDDAGKLLDEFLELCHRRRWHNVFVPSSDRFAALAPGRGCGGWKIGETPELDLKDRRLDGRSGAALRAALSRPGSS